MARPSRCRRICKEPVYDSFLPEGIPCGGQVTLALDEYEVIRLIDLEKLTHEQCARQMDISRTTVTEVYEAAREKIADCIVNGRPLLIAGGNYRFCDGSAARYCRKACRRKQAEAGENSAEGTGCSIQSAASGDALPAKGEREMRIAVTYENGEVYQHFGHTEQFKIYDVEDGKITKEEVVDTNGSGHGALAGFLKGLQVDTLICGGIGAGAQNALAEAGIRLYGGVSGNADEAVKALTAGTLAYNPDVHCDHHSHEHGEGHSCGHGHGHGHGEGHECRHGDCGR